MVEPRDKHARRASYTVEPLTTIPVCLSEPGVGDVEDVGAETGVHFVCESVECVPELGAYAVVECAQFAVTVVVLLGVEGATAVGVVFGAAFGFAAAYREAHGAHSRGARGGTGGRSAKGSVLIKAELNISLLGRSLAIILHCSGLGATKHVIK